LLTADQELLEYQIHLTSSMSYENVADIQTGKIESVWVKNVFDSRIETLQVEETYRLLQRLNRKRT